MNNNEYYNRIVSTLMQIEFDDKEELLNNYCNSEVKLTGELFGKEIKSELRIDENGIKGQINEEFLNANSNKEAIYTETPFILDDEIPVDYSSIQNGKSYHQNLLKAKLYDFKRRAMFLTILKMKMQSIFKRGLEI